jgi:CO/xanthine dehydrogenase FAD-binding subunit
LPRETSVYLRPDRWDAALAELALAPCTVLAGGTDVYPAHVGGYPTGRLLDISRLPGAGGVTVGSDVLRIGALTTWSDIARYPLPRFCRALAEAAREVGGIQIQNRATIGGNLCNASPAADGVPPLLALEARVEIASARGRRLLPLGEFVLGNRRTALAGDELLSAVEVPIRSRRAVSAFLKLGHRRYLVISIVMVAALLEFDFDGRVTYCGISVGACAPAARRLAVLEKGLVGVQRADVAACTTALLDGGALAVLAPIDDVRATRDYRLDAARSLVERVLAELAREDAA